MEWETKRPTQSDILVLEMQLDFNQLKENDHFLLLLVRLLPPLLFNAPFSKTITYSPSKLAANPFWQNFVSIKKSMHDWLEVRTDNGDHSISKLREKFKKTSFFPLRSASSLLKLICLHLETDRLFILDSGWRRCLRLAMPWEKTEAEISNDSTFF